MRFSTVAVAAAAFGSALAQDSDQSICDKYTVALLTNNTAANQYTLLTLLVKTVVLGNFTGEGTPNPTLPGSMNDVPGILATGMVGDEEVNLLPYFDGTLASSNRGGMSGVSVNFLDGGPVSAAINNPTALGSDGSNQAMLLTHLIQFFGALLGCSMYGSDDYPAYGGVTSQADVHRYMDLSEAEFTYFVTQVGLAATSFGASMDDVTTVANALNSTFGYRCSQPAAVLPDADEEPQVICQASDCPLATDLQSGCTGDAAYASYTPSMPATATGTMSMSGSMSGSATGTMMSGSMTMTGSMSSATADETSPNVAVPRQTAAAGIMAAAGLVAAALL